MRGMTGRTKGNRRASARDVDSRGDREGVEVVMILVGSMRMPRVAANWCPEDDRSDALDGRWEEQRVDAGRRETAAGDAREEASPDGGRAVARRQNGGRPGGRRRRLPVP